MQGKGQVDSPLVGLGTKEHLDQEGKEQGGGLAGKHHRQESRMQVAVGNSRPEVHTMGHGSHRTQEGSLTWTFRL